MMTVLTLFKNVDIVMISLEWAQVAHSQYEQLLTMEFHGQFRSIP